MFHSTRVRQSLHFKVHMAGGVNARNVPHIVHHHIPTTNLCQHVSFTLGFHAIPVTRAKIPDADVVQKVLQRPLASSLNSPRETLETRPVLCRACLAECLPSNSLLPRLRLPCKKSRHQPRHQPESSPAPLPGCRGIAQAKSPSPPRRPSQIDATPMHQSQHWAAIPSSP